jgi:hypothetical protein
MRAIVTKAVPIAIVVDTDEGTVDRVIVLDEMVGDLPDRVHDDGVEVRSETGTLCLGVAARKALAIADDSSIAWPVWEFGW